MATVGTGGSPTDGDSSAVAGLARSAYLVGWAARDIRLLLEPKDRYGLIVGRNAAREGGMTVAAVAVAGARPGDLAGDWALSSSPGDRIILMYVTV